MSKEGFTPCPHCYGKLPNKFILIAAGHIVGRIKSAKKAKAAATNGKKGGRPKGVKDSYKRTRKGNENKNVSD